MESTTSLEVGKRYVNGKELRCPVCVAISSDPKDRSAGRPLQLLLELGWAQRGGESVCPAAAHQLVPAAAEMHRSMPPLALIVDDGRILLTRPACSEDQGYRTATQQLQAAALEIYQRDSPTWSSSTSWLPDRDGLGPCRLCAPTIHAAVVAMSGTAPRRPR